MKSQKTFNETKIFSHIAFRSLSDTIVFPIIPFHKLNMCPKPTPPYSSCISICIMRHAVTPFTILVENCIHPPVNVPVFLEYLWKLQTFAILNKVSNSYIVTATATATATDYGRLGCHAVLSARRLRTFRMNLRPPCWGRKFQPFFGLLCSWMRSFCEMSELMYSTRLNGIASRKLISL